MRSSLDELCLLDEKSLPKVFSSQKRLRSEITAEIRGAGMKEVYLKKKMLLIKTGALVESLHQIVYAKQTKPQDWKSRKQFGLHTEHRSASARTANLELISIY